MQYHLDDYSPRHLACTLKKTKRIVVALAKWQEWTTTVSRYCVRTLPPLPAVLLLVVPRRESDELLILSVFLVFSFQGCTT
jgi:hypothetical protein